MSSNPELRRFKWIALLVLVVLVALAVFFGLTHKQHEFQINLSSSKAVQFNGKLKERDLKLDKREMQRMVRAVERQGDDVDKLYVQVSKMTDYETIGPDTRMLCELVLITADGRRLNAPPIPTTRARLVETVLRRLDKQVDAMHALDAKSVYRDKKVDIVVNPM